VGYNLGDIYTPYLLISQQEAELFMQCYQHYTDSKWLSLFSLFSSEESLDEKSLLIRTALYHMKIRSLYEIGEWTQCRQTAQYYFSRYSDLHIDSVVPFILLCFNSDDTSQIKYIENTIREQHFDVSSIQRQLEPFFKTYHIFTTPYRNPRELAKSSSHITHQKPSAAALIQSEYKKFTDKVDLGSIDSISKHVLISFGKTDFQYVESDFPITYGDDGFFKQNVAGTIMFDLSEQANTFSSNNYELIVNSKSDSAEGVWPIVSVIVNKQRQQHIYLSSAEETTTSINIHLHGQPLEQIALHYENNKVPPNSTEDRNIYYKKIILKSVAK
jgi:hypothetical protein